MSQRNDIVYIKEHAFPTLVALTAEDQAMGLMFRPSPAPVMVFPFTKAATHKFWMKNTIAPLDIIFCRANVVVAIHEGEPLSTKLVGPDEPVDLVVELPKGTASIYNIQPGDPVRLEFSLRTVSRSILEAELTY